MQGVSRSALTVSRQALQYALEGGADWSRLSEELFAVGAALDGSATLRRALADPSRDGTVKQSLAQRLFGGRVSNVTADLVGVVAAQRWSSDRDLADAVDRLGVEARLACAEAVGRADDVESQLFRFERTVAGTPALRDALSDPALPVERKTGLVDRLLRGRVHDEASAIVRHVVRHPRGRRFGEGIEQVLATAAERRAQLTAVATVAAPLTADQENRLRGALSSIYGTPILLQSVVDPTVVGGIRVQVGDEVVDGTVTRRLDEARRHLGA